MPKRINDTLIHDKLLTVIAGSVVAVALPIHIARLHAVDTVVEVEARLIGLVGEDRDTEVQP